MAIAPTGAIYKSLSFDGEDSRDYGVYITGEAVYNAPERDVEMITIPGRNGSFALDNGRFENIEVSYPAGIFADTEADFREAISDFRNFLCSRKGYVRLQDEYNPDEYRMAVYKSGLEVDPAMLKAGEFDITFDCKPQRWLTSGESAVTVTSGDTLTNPTLFEASPLLEVEGYGNIDFNGYEIELSKIEMGEVSLWPQTSSSAYSSTISESKSIPIGLLNIGDSFRLDSFKTKLTGATVSNSPITPGTPVVSCSGITGASATGTTESYRDNSWYGMRFFLNVNIPSIDFIYGTSKSVSCQASYSCTYTGGSTSFNTTITISYDGDSTATIVWNNPDRKTVEFVFPTASGTSTVEITGNIIFIDCDLGECYLINGGEPISLNHLVDLGSNLPTLSSGSNTITFDNTITSLKITPRWWKI